MSKELVISSAIVVVCLGVTVLALKRPSSRAIEPLPMTVDQPIGPRVGAPDFTTVANGPAFTPAPVVDSGMSGMNDGNVQFGSPDRMPPPPVLPVDVPVAIVPVASPEAPREHVVKSGETLGEISLTYYGTTRHHRDISTANGGLAPEELKVGQKLVIPVIAKAPPAAPVAGSATGSVEPGTYVVKPGDTYYHIARRELGDASRFRELEKLNGVAGEDLKVGMKLKLLPRSEPLASPSAPASGPEAPAGSRVHVVQRGEYLGEISTKHYGTSTRWRDIIKANPGVDPEGLHVGQKLVIPDLGPVVTRTTASLPSGSGSAGGSGTYVIASGDTLESIAQRQYGDRTQWRKIQAANPGLDPARLIVGRSIVVPDMPAAAVPAPITPPAPLRERAPLPPGPLSPDGMQPRDAIPGYLPPGPLPREEERPTLPASPREAPPLMPTRTFDDPGNALSQQFPGASRPVAPAPTPAPALPGPGEVGGTDWLDEPDAFR